MSRTRWRRRRASLPLSSGSSTLARRCGSPFSPAGSERAWLTGPTDTVFDVLSPLRVDTNTLKSYGIQSGNVIHLVLAVSAGAIVRREIQWSALTDRCRPHALPPPLSAASWRPCVKPRYLQVANPAALNHHSAAAGDSVVGRLGTLDSAHQRPTRPLSQPNPPPDTGSPRLSGREDHHMPMMIASPPLLQ